MKMPSHEAMLTLARKACASSPRDITALDAIDKAWKNSPEVGPAALTFRQIWYLADDGIDLDIAPPLTRPTDLAATKRPDDIL